MQNFELIILAVVQGITEFLPISSSAHLILLREFLSLDSLALNYDLILHLGSLISIIVYFFSDLKKIFLSLPSILKKQPYTTAHKLMFELIIATVPAAILGLLLQHYIEQHLRSINIIVINNVVFSILLLIVSCFSSKKKNSFNIGYKAAIFIGFAQSMALIPGVSRLGITLTAGLCYSLTYTNAARFSFLLAIPTVTGACLIKFIQLYQSNIVIFTPALLLALLVSSIVGYCSLTIFMRIVNNISIVIFSLYRILLAILVKLIM